MSSEEKERYYDEKYDHESSIKKINSAYSLLTLPYQDLIQYFSSPMPQEETPYCPHERAYQQAEIAAEDNNILESVLLLYSACLLGSKKARQIFSQKSPCPFIRRGIFFDDKNGSISAEEQFAHILYGLATDDYNEVIQELQTEVGKDHAITSARLSWSLLSDDEVERVFIEAITNGKNKIYFTQLLHEISASPFRIASDMVKEKLCKLVAPKNPNGFFTCLSPLQQGLLLAHQLM